MIYIVSIEPLDQWLQEIEGLSERAFKHLIDYSLWRGYHIDTEQYALSNELMSLYCRYKQPLLTQLQPVATVCIGRELDQGQTLIDGGFLWVKLAQTSRASYVREFTKRSHQHRTLDTPIHRRRSRLLSR